MVQSVSPARTVWTTEPSGPGVDRMKPPVPEPLEPDDDPWPAPLPGEPLM